MSQDPNSEKLVILCVGATGAGKSSTIDLFTNEKVESSSGVESKTLKNIIVPDSKDSSLLWMDTQGTSDSSGENDYEVMMKVLRLLHLTGYKKVKVIWFVTKNTRATQELNRQAKYINLLKLNSIWSSTVIIVKELTNPKDILSPVYCALKSGLQSEKAFVFGKNAIGYTCIDFMDQDDLRTEDYLKYGKEQRMKYCVYNTSDVKEKIKETLDNVGVCSIIQTDDKCEACGQTGDKRLFDKSCHKEMKLYHKKELIHPGKKAHPGNRYHPKASRHEGALVHPSKLVHNGTSRHPRSLQHTKGFTHTGSIKKEHTGTSYGVGDRSHSGSLSFFHPGTLYAKYIFAAKIPGTEYYTCCNSFDGGCERHYSCCKGESYSRGCEVGKYSCCGQTNKYSAGCKSTWACCNQKVGSNTGCKYECCKGIKNSSGCTYACCGGSTFSSTCEYSCCGGRSSSIGCTFSCCNSRIGSKPCQYDICKHKSTDKPCMHPCCDESINSKGCSYECCKQGINSNGCIYSCCEERIMEGPKPCKYECCDGKEGEDGCEERCSACRNEWGTKAVNCSQREHYKHNIKD